MTTAFQRNAFQDNAFQIDVGPIAVTINQGSGGSIAPRHRPVYIRRHDLEQARPDDDLDLIAQRLKASAELTARLEEAKTGEPDKASIKDGFKALQGLLELTDAKFVEAKSNELAKTIEAFTAAKRAREAKRLLDEAAVIAEQILRELQDEEDAITALLLA